MIKAVLILSCMLTMASCSNDITINTFQKYPDEFDEAGCGFYIPKKESELVFVNSGRAFMIINGKPEIFETDSSRSVSNTRDKWFYSNKHFDITVDLTNIEQIDYDSKYEGSIKVKAKSSGKETSTKIEGHCGC